MTLTESEIENMRQWMAVGVRVLALEVSDAGDAAESDAADADAARSGLSPDVGATVVEVFADGIRVLADDDSTGILRYDRDEFGFIIGHGQDDLPHGYREHWVAHRWRTGCPKCWMCARTAASEAHARGEEEGEYRADGHGAAVHRQN